mgnify:CR=1 FL=1
MAGPSPLNYFLVPSITSEIAVVLQAVPGFEDAIDEAKARVLGGQSMCFEILSENQLVGAAICTFESRFGHNTLYMDALGGTSPEGTGIITATGRAMVDIASKMGAEVIRCESRAWA